MTSNVDIAGSGCSFISLKLCNVSYSQNGMYVMNDTNDIFININEIISIQPVSNLIGNVPIYSKQDVAHKNDLNKQCTLLIVKNINEVYANISDENLLKKLGNKVKLL